MRKRGFKLHWGHQVGTLLLWRFNDKPTTPPEGSSAAPGVPGVPPSAFNPYVPQVLLGAQAESPLFTHSHRLASSAAPERALMVWRRVWPRTPNSLSSLMVDLPTKPLQPTSTGQTLDFHPRCSASTASSVYLRLLRSNASSTAASQGTVSSMMYTVWSEEDQSTRSGLRFVMAISEGKQSLRFRSAANFQSRAPPSWPMSDGIWTLTVFKPSRMNSLENEGWNDVGGRPLIFLRLTSKVAVRHFRTWLCRQV